MDVTQVPHTFVRTVKAQDLCFNQVDDVLERVRAGDAPTWVVIAFAVRLQLSVKGATVVVGERKWRTYSHTCCG